MQKRALMLLTVCTCILLSFAVFEISALSSTTADQTETDGGSDMDSSSDDQTDGSEYHDDPDDYVWDASEVIDIALNWGSIAVNSTSGVVVVDGSTATITSAGTYRITGTLTDGQIIVDTNDAETVRLILNGANISCSTSAPIYIKSAEKAVIVLAAGTPNYVTDGASYIFENAADDEPNAAVFSKVDLTIFGTGSLYVDGNYNDGIASKDGLIIESGTISVSSVDDGIRGKDYLVVTGGILTLNIAGDGLKSDNDEDAERGYISLGGCMVAITSGGDAIQAETDVIIISGEFAITSGGGSSRTIAASDSAKGIKGNTSVTISGGIFTINSADDSLHSNGDITISGGTFTLSTSDDGIHADSSVAISGGDINITKSYEGIEGATITISGGSIHAISSDDGINVAGGIDSSGMNPGPGVGGGWDSYTASGSYYLNINGGYIYLNANGDGIDANGAITMTGGYLIINGPTSSDNGALDFTSFQITGGFMLAVGSSGMAQAPASSSVQKSVSLRFGSTVQAGTLFNIQASDGTVLFSFVPAKAIQSIVFSSPALTAGTYSVYLGGSSTGTAVDGLYLGGVYTPGTCLGNYTISPLPTS